MKRYLWIENAALFKSEYYNGHATLLQSAEMYPEHTTQSKYNPNTPELAESGITYVPVIKTNRCNPFNPYQGNTEWHEAANILLDKLSNE